MEKREIVNYVKNKNMSLPEYQFNSLQVLVKEPLPENIDITKVFNDVASLLPDHFLKLVDVVYVGDFDFLNERDINALYMDGAIYVSNVQDSNDDMKDDIVHEVGHALEQHHKQFIYEDGKIENEYFAKIHRLEKTLEYEGHDTNSYEFRNLEYNPEFDDFLFKEIGYESLENLTNGLFVSPYSVTSLREYWSTGFEEYFLGDRLYLKNVCPYINKKLTLLVLDETLYGY